MYLNSTETVNTQHKSITYSTQVTEIPKDSVPSYSEISIGFSKGGITHKSPRDLYFAR